MRLVIFKHRDFWWAAIITPGGDWEPAAVFLSWDSALREGLLKLRQSRQSVRVYAELGKRMLGETDAGTWNREWNA